MPYLRPDGKTQVTIEYDGDKPVRLDTVVVSSQHAADIDIDTLLAPDIAEFVVAPDGWALRTADGSRAAHMEHTVAITDDGPRILTLP